MSRWPTKPQVTREGERIGVFIGTAYQFMTMRDAASLASQLQRTLAIARRDFKHRGPAAAQPDQPRKKP